MITIDIEKRGNQPIYEYIYNHIREEILSGRLGSGERLPSKRELAQENGVALITVENAYEQLIIEGYAYAIPRRGYFVSDIELIDSVLVKKEITDNTVLEEINANTLKDNNSNTLIEETDVFPYSVWSRLMRRVISDSERRFAYAPPSKGVIELRQAICDYLFNSKGLIVYPESVIVGPGTEYLHSIILQLIGRNRLVAVEDPGYKKAGRIYESNGMKVMHIPVDEEGIKVEKLYNSNISLVHVSPSHHFPTGAVMPAAKRHKLLSWAREQDAYIIEDDYDSELRYKGRPLPTIMSFEDEHVIYMNTFTGTLSPSIRIAYMVLPDKLMKKYEEKLEFISGTVSTFEQLTLAAFIAEGYYERHINRMRNRYKKVRELYMETFEKSRLANSATINIDQAGLRYSLSIPDINNIDKFVYALKKKGILINSFDEYCYKTENNYKNIFIMKYMDVPQEKLLQIFEDIQSSFEACI